MDRWLEEERVKLKAINRFYRNSSLPYLSVEGKSTILLTTLCIGGNHDILLVVSPYGASEAFEINL